MCGEYTKVSCLQELTVGKRQEDKNDPHSGSLLVFLIVVPNFHLFRQLQASQGQVLPAPPLHRLGVTPNASLTPPRTFQRIRVGSWFPPPPPPFRFDTRNSKVGRMSTAIRYTSCCGDNLCSRVLSYPEHVNTQL